MPAAKVGLAGASIAHLLARRELKSVKLMDLASITALLYLASFAFLHAGKKRSAYAAMRRSSSLRVLASAMGWLCVALAAALIVSRKGFEVGIPLWIGAWVVAAVISVFLSGLWPRAHAPLAMICAAVFVFGLASVPWGGAL